MGVNYTFWALASLGASTFGNILSVTRSAADCYRARPDNIEREQHLLGTVLKERVLPNN